MRPLNNKGIAIVTALMFTLIILALILSVLTMVNQGTKATASMKVYRNATEAAYGGADVVMQDVIPRLFANISTSIIKADYNSSSFNKFMEIGSSNCLKQKRDKANIGTNWSACGDKSINAKLSSDMTFQLVGTNNQSFKVYSKIVDTVPGVEYPDNTLGADGKPVELLGGGVTAGAGGGGGGSGQGGDSLIQRYVYRIEVASEKLANAKESSKVSVLYEY